MDFPGIRRVKDYEPLIGAEAVARIYQKAHSLEHLHIANVNSTYYGGGVAELLSSLTLLMNSTGIKTSWRVIQGAPDFFSITKKMHNALQGAEINLSDRKCEIYQAVVYENAVRNHLDNRQHEFGRFLHAQPGCLRRGLCHGR
jgi:trehalose synthase